MASTTACRAGRRFLCSKKNSTGDAFRYNLFYVIVQADYVPYINFCNVTERG